jgi:predicted Rossmann fold nucleotide-binding protein DprA/Smf involved in DNA uptake
MNNTEHQLSPDTQAILLLCSHFGKKTAKNEVQPLTPSEYAWLAHWLHEQQLRPADLLDSSATLKLKPVAYKNITASRVLTLLRRGAAMAVAVETWTNNGLWVLSRSDKSYPARLKTRLGQAAPPLFYGVGQSLLLPKGGLAIVGSREVDAEIIDFTKRLAKLAAQQGITVISGGARGVDTDAMLTALAQGRYAVGVLADSLVKSAVSSKYRDALREERLVLISPFDPNAGFNVGNAMARNKYIYALSDWAMVVNSDYEQGGTWAGAVENLRAGWVPLLVRKDENISVGNQQLLNQGAIAVDKTILQHTTDLREHLQRLTAKVVEQATPYVVEPTWLKETLTEETLPEMTTLEEAKSPKEVETKTVNYSDLDKAPKEETPPDLFEVVWPYIEQQLVTEKTEQELAESLDLHTGQLKIWLKRALELGKVKKLNKPVRYVKATAFEEKQSILF